jgi:hypothetical protein
MNPEHASSGKFNAFAPFDTIIYCTSIRLIDVSPGATHALVRTRMGGR